MATVLIVAGYGNSLLWFRRDLIAGWLERGLRVMAAAPGREVEDRLKEMGVEYREIPLSRTGLNPLKDLSLFFSLLGLIKKERPEYIFTYTVKPVVYTSLAAYFYRGAEVYAMITGLGFVFTAAGAGNAILRKVVSGLYRLALHRARKVFFQNGDDRELFLNLGLLDARKVVMVNGSGVNTEHFSPLPLPEGPPGFLLIARFLKEKGIREYVQAAGIMKAKYPGLKFALLGWMHDNLPGAIGEDEVEAWKKEGIVDVYGETDDVRPFYGWAAVYVLPSYREGTPRTVLEAMATGRPVITSDAPGCRETVVNGVTGYLVPVGDVPALAAAMERFILEPGLIEKMGAEGRRLAVEKFDVHRVNKTIYGAMGL